MGAAVAALFAMVGLPAQEARTPVQEVIAAATLAESKGDLEGAKKALEKALTGASPAEQKQLQVALAELAQRTGTQPQEGLLNKLANDPEAARRLQVVVENLQDVTRRVMPESQGPDPVQRLVAVLEEGSHETKKVYDAQRQLKELGALAVPPLLAAMPKAGPFGLVNAMSLLEPHSDPRIAPALLERANADPAIAALVIEHSQRMSDVVRVALVTGLDEAKLPAPARLQLADVMSSAPGTAARRKAIALQLADEPSVQRELGGKVGKWNVSWASEVFTRLRAAKDPVAAASATAQWLSVQQDLDEATALAAIESLDARHRWWVARQVTERYPAWAKVALLGLGEGADNDRLETQAWFGKVEWWHGGGDAALKLIELTKAHPELRGHYANRAQFRDCFKRILEAGWSVPPDAESLLANIRVDYLATALPKEDEARALAAWRRLGREDQYSFVSAVVELGRPWHRVIVAQLATAQQWSQMQLRWIERDWTGVPADAAAELVALAKRFPRQPVGQPTLSQGTATTLSGSPAWPRALVAACERTPELPPAILVTFATAGDEFAWRVLAKRDPGAALELVRDPEQRWLGDLAQLLGGHGTAADVPTLVRLLEWHGLSDDELRQVRPFIERHCRGNLDVADRLCQQGQETLVSKLQPPSDLHRARRELAMATAAGVAMEQLAELIERAPHLQREVVDAAAGAMQNRVNAAQAPILAQALDKALTREPLSDAQVALALTLMQKCASPECLPAVRRALANPRLGDLVMHAAQTAIAVAGPQRKAVLLELLGSTDHRVVQMALDAEGLGQDKELMLAATNAMYAHGKQLGSVAKLFGSLDLPTRAATARSIIRNDDFPRFHRDFCGSVVWALGDSRDVMSIPDLALAARHPSHFVRLDVAQMLGRVFAPEAATPLLDLLKDDEDAVRKIAKDSLDRLAEYLDARTKWDERLHRK